MEKARRASLNITIEGVDVSRDIAPFLLSFEYVDNPPGEADEVQIELEDPDGRFRGDWLPKRNARIVAEIAIADWHKPGDVRSLACGSFEIDEIQAGGPPSTVSIKGVSAPVTSKGRREQRTRAWEEITLREIASDVANQSKLTLSYETAKNPKWRRIDQREESPLAFLNRMAVRAGLSVKVVDDKLVLFDDEEQSGSVTIRMWEGEVVSWEFGTQSGDVYKSCEVAYRDPKKKSFVKAVAMADGEEDEPSGHTKKVNTRVETQAEAERIARDTLKHLNRREVTGSMTLLGNPSLVVGMKATVAGFGTFDGTYNIAKTTHAIGNGGYTTSIELDDGSPKIRKGGKGSRKKKNEKSWVNKIPPESRAKS